MSQKCGKGPTFIGPSQADGCYAEANFFWLVGNGVQLVGHRLASKTCKDGDTVKALVVVPDKSVVGMPEDGYRKEAAQVAAWLRETFCTEMLKRLVENLAFEGESVSGKLAVSKTATEGSIPSSPAIRRPWSSEERAAYYRRIQTEDNFRPY